MTKPNEKVVLRITATVDDNRQLKVKTEGCCANGLLGEIIEEICYQYDETIIKIDKTLVLDENGEFSEEETEGPCFLPGDEKKDVCLNNCNATAGGTDNDAEPKESEPEAADAPEETAETADEEEANVTVEPDNDDATENAAVAGATEANGTPEGEEDSESDVMDDEEVDGTPESEPKAADAPEETAETAEKPAEDAE